MIRNIFDDEAWKLEDYDSLITSAVNGIGPLGFATSGKARVHGALYSRWSIYLAR